MKACLMDFSQLAAGKDTRIPVLAALGDSVPRILGQLVAAVEPAQKPSVVVFAPGSRPENWPPDLRLRLMTEDELSTSEGCLCCAMQTGLASMLQSLFLSLLRRTEAPVKAVIVVSEAKTVDALAATLKHAPFIGQRYRLLGSLPLSEP
jgi:hypothetical protein